MKADTGPEPFEYQIRVAVRFSAQDLRVLRYFACRHYDSACRSFFREGNTGFGWHNCFSQEGEPVNPFDVDCPAELESDAPIAVSFSELDRCLKILEGASWGCHDPNSPRVEDARRLEGEIRDCAAALRAEHARLLG